MFGLRDNVAQLCVLKVCKVCILISLWYEDILFENQCRWFTHNLMQINFYIGYVSTLVHTTY